MIVRLLRLAVLAAAWGYLALYGAVALLRLRFPFELEWMEGGSLHHVARVVAGEPLYVAPGLEFIPFQYPPLYYYLSAAVSWVTGPGFLPLRVVSIAASLVSFAAIHALVHGETGSRFGGLVAAGLFAATFRAGGAWLDIGRVDSLFLALFLLALLLLRRGRSPGADVAAGVFFGLSFLAKQTALAMCAPLVAFLLVSAPYRGLLVAATTGTIIAASTAALHAASGGWYTFYVFRFPFLHPWVPSVFLSFWTTDILRPLPVAALAAASLAARRLRPPRAAAGFWLMAAAGMVGGAYRSRLQTGGYDNVLLPAYAVLAILSGVALATTLRRTAAWEDARRRRAQAAIYSACLVQMALLAYDPRAVVPTAADRKAGEEVVGLLAGVDGDVFVPYHGYLSMLAGKRPYAHLMSVFDMVKVGLPESEALAREHRAALRDRRFAAVVLDDRASYLFSTEVQASYALERELFADPAVFFPTTGLRTRPQYLYRARPRPTEEAPDGRPPAR